MQQRKQHTAFAVDGYAITASFADCKMRQRSIM